MSIGTDVQCTRWTVYDLFILLQWVRDQPASISRAYTSTNVHKTQKQKESTAKKIKSRKPYAIMNDMRGLCGQTYYINMNHICISPFEQWMSPWLMIVCGKTLHVNHIHMAFHISFFLFCKVYACHLSTIWVIITHGCPHFNRQPSSIKIGLMNVIFKITIHKTEITSNKHEDVIIIAINT